jgi:flagellar basal-body rod protein FlgB
MLNKIDKEIHFVQSALNLRAKRQEILAANIANSDTPNYKARDIDFSAALKRAIGASGSLGGSFAMNRTQARHLESTSFAGGMGSDFKYRSTVQPSLDGNTVDMDVERAHFTENSLHYQFLIDRATSAFSTMKQAVGGDR